MLLTDPWVESEASGDASAKKSKLLRKLDRKEEKEKLREEKEKLREEKEQKVREERQRSKTASLGSMPPPNTSTRTAISHLLRVSCVSCVLCAHQISISERQQHRSVALPKHE